MPARPKILSTTTAAVTGKTVPSYHLPDVLCQVHARGVENLRNDSQAELRNVCAELQNGANKRPHLVRLDGPVAVLYSVGIWSVAIARAGQPQFDNNCPNGKSCTRNNAPSSSLKMKSIKNSYNSAVKGKGGRHGGHCGGSDGVDRREAGPGAACG